MMDIYNRMFVQNSICYFRNIRQKKSVLNEAYKDLDDAMPFLQEWQQWVKKNLSEEPAGGTACGCSGE